MSELRYPEWQTPYHEALMETDEQKLRDKLFLAEAKICERLQAISALGTTTKKKSAIADAVNGLRTIEREMLNYPDWNCK